MHIAELKAAFDRSLELLRHGDPARPLFTPRDEEWQNGLHVKIHVAWHRRR